MGHKAAEKTHHINSTLELLTSGDERLEDEECNDWPSEVDNDQLRGIIKADPLTTT